MTGFFNAMFRQDGELVDNAKTLGGVAACRIHRRERVTDMETGEGRFVWRIEFKTAEDAEMFDAAVRNIVDSIAEEGR